MIPSSSPGPSSEPASTHPPQTPATTVPGEFAPELREILEAETRAGNSVSEVRTGGPFKGTIVVILTRPFLTPRASDSKNLRYHRVSTPGWWSAEYTTAVPPHTLASP